VGDKLYVFGGFYDNYEKVTGRLDILDLNTGRWSRGRPLPGAQTHFGAGTDGRYLYLAGGQYGPGLSPIGTSEAWRYDTQTDRWTAFAPIPDVRFGGQMQYLDGRLHFVGGNDTSRVRSRSEHWIFEIDRPDKGWYVGSPLPMVTDHHSSIVVQNQLYVLGGEVEHGTSYLSNSGMYRYDARANRWITMPDLPEALSHVEAATLTDGKRIFVVGGQVNPQQLTSRVYSFDIARNRWVQHTSMPTARKAGIAWLNGNRLFYMTGDDVRFGEPRTTYQGVIG
jgi:N-acetylneuraminic acid mutarotase